MDKKDKEQEEFLKEIEKKLHGQNSPNGSEKPPFSRNPKKQQGQAWNRFSYFLIFLLVIFTFLALDKRRTKDDPTQISYSQFMNDVGAGDIKEVLIVENLSIIEFSKDGVAYTTRIPYTDINLVEKLLAGQVVIHSETREQSRLLLIFLQWLPWIVLMVFFWFIISRQLRGRGSEAFSFGKSKAQMISSHDIKERFDDVKGCQEAIDDLKDIVAFLRNPRQFSTLGARTPKGVLLVGLPGTGKTLLAKAVAGESNVPFFSISGSDFVEMFVGVGASRVRSLFENGKKHSPCIIFIDEIDAVGRARGAGYGGGHDEREQTLNQLLVEMDGFATGEGIILMAATNRPDVLDKALLRPGRFDRQVVVEVPDMLGREGILAVHAKKIKLSRDVKLNRIARSTAGMTGADLANVINEAALIAAKNNKRYVEVTDLDKAKDKVLLGSERRSMFISPQEKLNTAYHEAGHALVSLLSPNANDLDKVTIIPRGRALGITHFLPKDGKHTMNKKALEAELRVLYGGRVAEELIFKDVTNGAMNDIERATEIAKSMVCEWGLSRLGPIAFSEKKTSLYLPSNEYGATASVHSEEVTKKIDLEIKRILDTAYAETKALLKKYNKQLRQLAELLLEKETVGMDELRVLLKFKAAKIIPASPEGTKIRSRKGSKSEKGKELKSGRVALNPA